jgi:ABC-type amino acid transport substrate-binding protein
MKRIILFTIIALLSTYSFSADKLRVGYKIEAPFVIEDEDGELSGIAIELFESVAKRSGLVYEYVEIEGSFDDSFPKLGEDLDIIVSDVTITSPRLDIVDFTQPYFVTNTVVAKKRNNESSIWSIVSMSLLKSIGILMLFIIVAGLTFWIVERKINDGIDKDAMGIFDGMYFASATMTTVGYGDVAAKSKVGKVLSFFLMWVSLGLVGYFYGNITSALTEAKLSHEIESLSSLNKMKVATIDGSASALYLKRNGIRYVSYDNPEEALDAINDDELDAFVYDEPILRYLTGTNKYNQIDVGEKEFYEQRYGFAVTKESGLDGKMNSFIMGEICTERWETILSKYNLD